VRCWDVLIVDHQALARAGARAWLEQQGEVRRVGECRNANEALQQLREHLWHLVLLEIALADRRGFGLLRRIANGWPDSKVLVVSSLPEENYAAHALRAGAAGFIEKHQPAEVFRDAVRQVLAGRHFLSGALAEQLAAAVTQPESRPAHSALNAREFQIFYNLAGGRPMAQIADELCLSAKTVSTYRKRIARKMGLHCNADFTRYALAHGLRPPEIRARPRRVHE